MNEIEILNQIKKFLKKYTKVEITLNSNIKKIGLDSLDLIDLIMEAEEKFSIQIPDDELLKIQTIKDLVDKIQNSKK